VKNNLIILKYYGQGLKGSILGVPKAIDIDFLPTILIIIKRKGYEN